MVNNTEKHPIRVDELEAKARIQNFDEVIFGYNEEQALREASRCLQCKNPACISGCPVNIDIKQFIKHLSEKEYSKAYYKIREKNNFPSICGRICPAEYQCRKACVLNKKGANFASAEAININFLERFAGDYGINNNLVVAPVSDASVSEKRVAVVGSGPAGLCCAGELARLGVKVSVFEALHKTGGVLRYGIPPFRLPRHVLDFEIDYLKEQGVKFVPNHIIGNIKSLDELFASGFSAVFLGLGAGTPTFLGIPGENLVNIYSANEFLTRVNLMSAYRYPEFHTPVNIGKNVVVIGGGNTAMDAARVALRLQGLSKIPPKTTIVYRRTEVELPARRLEIEHAKEEGINFDFLLQPVEFIGDQDGFVKKLKCLRCKLGEPDASGRRSPVVIAASEFEIDCDLAVVAIGLKANQVLIKATPGLKVNKYSDVVVDPDSMMTSINGVFAGGDIVGGEGTVIEAMGMAKKAARGILKFLKQI